MKNRLIPFKGSEPKKVNIVLQEASHRQTLNSTIFSSLPVYLFTSLIRRHMSMGTRSLIISGVLSCGHVIAGSKLRSASVTECFGWAEINYSLTGDITVNA